MLVKKTERPVAQALTLGQGYMLKRYSDIICVCARTANTVNATPFPAGMLARLFNTAKSCLFVHAFQCFHGGRRGTLSQVLSEDVLNLILGIKMKAMFRAETRQTKCAEPCAPHGHLAAIC